MLNRAEDHARLAALRERYDAYAARHDLKRAGGRIGWERLLGKRGPFCYGPEYLPCRLDHFSLWSRNGKAVRFLTEPYGVTTEEILALHSWAFGLGLAVRVDAEESPYYPGATNLVEIGKPEEFTPAEARF